MSGASAGSHMDKSDEENCLTDDGQAKTFTPGESPEHKRQESKTIVLLFLSWVVCTFCRDHLFVVGDAFQADTGTDEGSYALMMASGYAAYTAGKLVWGFFADRYGGKLTLMCAIIGMGLLSCCFAATNSFVTSFSFWTMLRLFQPAGWIGLVKLASMWVPWTRAGRAMAVLSLSITFGEVAARGCLAWFISIGWSWRAVILASAAITMSLAVPDAVMLRRDPQSVNLPQLPVNPNTSSASSDKSKASTAGLLRSLVRDTRFLLVCLLSFLFTAVRETLTTFSVSYLISLGASDSTAAAASTVLALCGAPSVYLAGVLFDKVPTKWRGGVVPVLYLPAAVSLFVVATLTAPSVATVTLLLAAIGFGLMGPYSLLAGAFALEIGEETGAGTVSALVDAAGYSGAVAMMFVRAWGLGFSELFAFLTGLSAAALAAGVLLTLYLKRITPSESE